MIFEYIKDKDGHRRGVICALEKNGIGWSLCNVKAGDRFNKSLALRIAAGRAMKNSVKSEKTFLTKQFLILGK